MALPLEHTIKLNSMTHEQNYTGQGNRFESDTQRLTHKHLADPNHVISEEELAQVRVGMSPGPDAPTQTAIHEAEDRISDKKKDSEEDLTPGAQKATPWNIVDPT
jgi:hypothetical protein